MISIEVMEMQMSNPKRAKCGSNLLAEGALYGLRRTSFRPKDSKFLTLETGDVMTKATMCRKCGLIEITGDVSKLLRLTSKTETGDAETT